MTTTDRVLGWIFSLVLNGLLLFFLWALVNKEQLHGWVIFLLVIDIALNLASITMINISRDAYNFYKTQERAKKEQEAAKKAGGRG